MLYRSRICGLVQPKLIQPNMVQKYKDKIDLKVKSRIKKSKKVQCLETKTRKTRKK